MRKEVSEVAKDYVQERVAERRLLGLAGIVAVVGFVLSMLVVLAGILVIVGLILVH